MTQRKHTIALIDQARSEGARLNIACSTVEIDPANYRRWQQDGEVVADRRATAQRPLPSKRLT